MKSSEDEEEDEEEEEEGLEESLNTSSRGISFPAEGDVMFRRGGVKSSDNRGNRKLGVGFLVDLHLFSVSG